MQNEKIQRCTIRYPLRLHEMLVELAGLKKMSYNELVIHLIEKAKPEEEIKRAVKKRYEEFFGENLSSEDLDIEQRR